MQRVPSSSSLAMLLALCAIILSTYPVAGKRHAFPFPNMTDATERRMQEDGILCVEVQEIEVLDDIENGGVMTHSLVCRLDPQHTNGVAGMMAILEGVEVTERDDAVAQYGQDVSLLVVGGILSENFCSLKAPPGASTLVWTTPSLPNPEEDGVFGRRRLAVASSSSGIKRVLIVRITVTGMSLSSGANSYSSVGPSGTLLSDEVFGLGADKVNLRSQYLACSYGQLEMVPASDGTYPLNDNYYIQNGIVTVNVGNVQGDPFALSNAANALLGGESDEHDIIMYSLPYGTEFAFSQSWLAFAYQPGKESWFNSDWILYPSVQLHEVGHSMGLSHSNTPTREYADVTGIMGFGYNIDEQSKCFNGAKMVQLGWYNGAVDPEMDRVQFVKPLAGSWSGKVTSVADYGNSLEEHAVVVVIEEATSETSWFLTYNRAKGITANTNMYKNQLTITETEPRGIPGNWPPSVIHQGLDVGQSYELTEFGPYLDTVVITVVGSSSDVGLDGKEMVEYLDVIIELRKDACTADSECVKTGGSCTTAACVVGFCEYTLQEDCCGNHVCERFEGETCGNCPQDCFGLDECAVMHGEGSSAIIGYYDGNPTGFMFDVEANSDIYVYSLGIVIVQGLDPNFNTIDGEIYTKLGSHQGYQGMGTQNSWEQVGDATVVGTPTGLEYTNGVVYFPANMYSVPLTESIFMEAGEKRSFYVTSTSNLNAQYVVYGGSGTSVTTPVQSNTDLTVYEGRIMTYKFIPRSNVVRWKGSIGYYHPAPELLSAAQLLTDTPSSSPSQGPSAKPSVSPSSPPSASPSFSPSSPPSDKPSVSPPSPTPPSTISGENLIENGSFEQEAFWKFGGKKVYTVGYRHCALENIENCVWRFDTEWDGVSQIPSKKRHRRSNLVYFTESFAGSAGEKFTLSFAYKGLKTPKSLLAKFVFFDKNKRRNGLAKCNVHINTDYNAWETHTCTYKTSKEWKWIRLVISFFGETGGTGTVDIDDVSLIREQ